MKLRKIKLSIIFLLETGLLCSFASSSIAQSSITSIPEYADSSSARSQIRMQIMPRQSTVLSSEIAGRVTDLEVKEGDSFQSGQTIARLDCSMHRARLDKATAQAKEAEQILAVNKQLDTLGSISVLEVSVADSRLSAARAEANLMQAVVDRCEIQAPFSGKVSILHVKAHQYVAEGQELVGILDDSELDVEMVVPSRWLSGLKIEQKFQVSIDETGKSYPAYITRFGAAIDPVSQSIKVFGKVDGNFNELRAGMSGVARLIEP